jgi:hypothetical protein
MREPIRIVCQRYYDLIASLPGLRLADYARIAGRRADTVQGVIVSMEDNGYLLCEDDEGRVYPCRIVVRYPQDTHGDPVGHTTSWKRYGTERKVQDIQVRTGRLPRSLKTKLRNRGRKCATI